ncbi:MAG: c-type cytochrome [Bacillota bacterium]
MKEGWFAPVLNVILGALLVFLLFIYEGPKETPMAAEDSNMTPTADGNAEEIVNANCISCHGENLLGGAGPALDKIGSNYAQDEIEDIINNGRGGMPGGIISADEAKIVAEWLAQKQ